MPAEAETSGLTSSSNLLHRHCVNASRYVNRKAKLLRSSYEGLSFLNSPLSYSMQRRYVNLLIFYTRVKNTRVKSRPPVFYWNPGWGFKSMSSIRISPKKKLQVKILLHGDAVQSARASRISRFTRKLSKMQLKTQQPILDQTTYPYRKFPSFTIHQW